jgi:predicted metal-dependent phosphoesterase TrpH
VFNARCMNPAFNPRARGFAESHGILKGAGSDSHFLFEFGSTWVNLPSLSQDDLDSPKAVLRALASKGTTIHGKCAPIYARGTTKVISIVRRKLLGHKS